METLTFEFAAATRIRFGAGAVGELPAALAEMGRRFLVVVGRSPERLRLVLAGIETAGLELRPYAIRGEPSVDDVGQGAALGRQERVDGVLALGGGSVLDGGKAIAALITNADDPFRYLEVIGEGRPLDKAPVPFVAVPTTAGTGTEVTRNAVLTSPTHRVKVSLRSPRMLARLAIVDPELSYRLPPGPTAATGLDALTQLIEPFVSCRANPLVDAVCREGLRRVASSLVAAYGVAQRLESSTGGVLTEAEQTARSDLALAALFGGLALSNAALGAVHGFAGPIGGTFGAPHGAVCAALLPQVMEVNLHALRMRQPASPVPGRFDEIARLLTGRTDARAEDGIEWVQRVCRDFRIPGLGRYGVTHEHVANLVGQAAKASSMKGNPLSLTPDEMAGILTRAM